MIQQKKLALITLYSLEQPAASRPTFSQFESLKIQSIDVSEWNKDRQSAELEALKCSKDQSSWSDWKDADNGWYPELVILIVVLFNSTILTQVIANSSVLCKYFHWITIPKSVQS